MPLEEKPEGPLQADDKGQPRDEEDLCTEKQACMCQLTGGGCCSGVTAERTFPMARRALSKNSIIPKRRKNTPKPVSPIPISVDDIKNVTSNSLPTLDRMTTRKCKN